ncbi:MAG: hypothetical protein PVF58_14805 [Candidatus Methanofastidiosia archaeon]
MRTMGEIIEKIRLMEREDMPSWLKGNELQYDIIEKNLKEYADWLLKEE